MAIELEERPQHRPHVTIVIGDDDRWKIAVRKRRRDTTQRSPLSTIPFEF